MNEHSIGVIHEGGDSFLMTHSGTKVSVLNPKPEQIKLEDIAHALSLQCRYNGHVDRFYSVAEHVLKGYTLSNYIVLSNNPGEIIKAWLLHDASEAYVGDLIRPVKMHIEPFVHLEEGFMEVIYDKFGVARRSEDVRYLDNVMAALEKENMFPNNKEVWHGLPPVKHLNGVFEEWGLSPNHCEESLLTVLREHFKE